MGTERLVSQSKPGQQDAEAETKAAKDTQNVVLSQSRKNYRSPTQTQTQTPALSIVVAGAEMEAETQNRLIVQWSRPHGRLHRRRWALLAR